LIERSEIAFIINEYKYLYYETNLLVDGQCDPF
jgi:hypothetical protein